MEALKEYNSSTSLNLTDVQRNNFAYIIDGNSVIGMKDAGKPIILVGYTDEKVIYVDAKTKRKTGRI